MTGDAQMNAYRLMMTLGDFAVMAQQGSATALIADGEPEDEAFQHASGMLVVTVISAAMEHPEWARAVATLIDRAGNPALRVAYHQLLNELVQAVPVTIVHEPEGGAG